MRDDPLEPVPTYESRTVELGGRDLRLRSAAILSNNRSSQRIQLIVWRLYWIDGQFIASDARAKLAGMVARLQGRGDEGALLTLHAEQSTKGDADAVLERFMRDNEQALNRLLSQVHQAR